jgi:membrane fusion protein, multidrug efflux system
MKSSRVIKRIVLAVLPLFLAGAAVFIWISVPSGTVTEEAGPEKAQPLPVRTIRPETRDMAERVLFLGVVEPRYSALLSSAASGTILSLAEAGTEAREGDLLVLIDPEPYRAAYRQAASAYRAAEAAYERARANHAAGSISLQTLDQAETAFENTLGHYEQARIALSSTETKAPFNGTVTRRMANRFEASAPGRPLLMFESTGELLVKAEVAERHASLFSSSEGAVSVALDGSDAGATILRVDPGVKPETRTFTVLSLIHPEESGSFVPGTLLRGEFLFKFRRAVPALPVSALTMEGKLWYVKDEGGRLKATPWSPDPPFMDEGYIEIPHTLGDYPFITAGRHSLTEGRTVRIIEDSP